MSQARPTLCRLAPGAAVLALVLAPAALRAQVLQGAARAGTSQRGHAGELAAAVVDAQHHPIDRAEVSWLRGDDAMTTRTDATGRFSFGVVGPGSYRISVRRLGYQPRVLSVTALGTSGEAPEVVLEPMPVGFEAIHVVARVNASQGKLAEFYERRGRPNRLGYFLEERELGRFEYLHVSDYLRGIPGVTLSPSAGVGNLVRFRGCQPMVYLDGLRMEHAEADDLVLAKDVAALEVYVSPAGTPGQFRDLTQPCGSIVIWKKT